MVERSAALLRGLSQFGAGGASTTEVARTAGLPRPTAHRLLTALHREGFVDRHNETGTWHLGPELFLLGSVAAQRYDLTEVALPHVKQLAEITGESAFFSARRGDETVCLLREDGDFPIRSFVLYEGARFPLGVVSAGLVILAHLPDREVTEYLERHDLTTDYGQQHGTECRHGSDPPNANRWLCHQPGSDRGGQLGDGGCGLRPPRTTRLGAEPDRDPSTLRCKPSS